MTLFHILLLAIVQGAAELLPVSSSAHVIVAEKLLGLDPTRPEMTLLLVMLHTGTMFAVIVYFWNAWRASFFRSRPGFLAVPAAAGVGHRPHRGGGAGAEAGDREDAAQETRPMRRSR